MSSKDPLRSHLPGEWAFELNSKDISVISYANNDSYWWKCGVGLHPPYSAAPANRWFSLGGCPACAPSSYKTNLPGKLYFIKNAEKNSYKVGITNPSAKTNRVQSFQRRGWELIHAVESGDGLLIKHLERRVFIYVRQNLGLGQALDKVDMRGLRGETETFSMQGVSESVVIATIDFELASLDANSPPVDNSKRDV
jgi:hypothetical protein